MNQSILFWLIFLYDRYKLEIGTDGSYKPIAGYNHHVHPTPHPTFDTMPETLREPKSGFSQPSKMGLFKEDVDTFERKPFYVNSPTVKIN